MLPRPANKFAPPPLLLLVEALVSSLAAAPELAEAPPLLKCLWNKPLTFNAHSARTLNTTRNFIMKFLILLISLQTEPTPSRTKQRLNWKKCERDEINVAGSYVWCIHK